MIGSSSSSISNSNSISSSRRRELRLSSSSSALSSSTTTTTIGSSGISSSSRRRKKRKLFNTIPIVVKLVYYVIIAILILIFLFSNIKIFLNNNPPRINSNIVDVGVGVDVGVAVKQPAATVITTITTTTVEKEELQLQSQPELPLMPLLPSYVRTGSCAILLFGLPRSFQQYVLPSIRENIIRPNLHYNCDYYIHYYDLGLDGKEESGRSGRGGVINSNDIYLLNQTIHDIYKDEKENNNNPIMTRMPIIKFISDTNETFWKKREKEIMKYRTTKEDDKDNGKNKGKGKNNGNNYKYFPYKELTYVYPKTIDNIVKQWHSIHSVWKLMEQYNTVKEDDTEDNEEDTESIKKKKSMKKTKKKYRRIAMIRNDVMYITPIDIYEIPKLELTDIPGNDYTKAVPQQQRQKSQDDRQDRQYDYIENRISVIPNFAKYPVNDRFIYGPYDCVKIWASQRFTQIDDYANNNSNNNNNNNSSPKSIPGMVMHSETFLNASILQSIKELKYSPLPLPSHPNSNSNSNSIISAEGSNNNNYYEIREDRFICFLRVRADGAIWYEDCDPKKSDYGGGYPGGIGQFNTITTGSIVEQDVNNNGDTNTGYINKIYSLLEVIASNNNQTGTAKTKIKCRRRRLKDPVRLIYELICK